MSVTIKLKNSKTKNNTPQSLEFGELAINHADKKIYMLDTSNNLTSFESPLARINNSIVDKDNQCTANDTMSFACGQSTSTQNKAEFTCGTYNEPFENKNLTPNYDTIFTIGNGDKDNDLHHNALAVFKNGTIEITDPFLSLENYNNFINYPKYPYITLQNYLPLKVLIYLSTDTTKANIWIENSYGITSQTQRIHVILDAIRQNRPIYLQITKLPPVTSFARETTTTWGFATITNSTSNSIESGFDKGYVLSIDNYLYRIVENLSDSFQTHEIITYIGSESYSETYSADDAED